MHTLSDIVRFRLLMIAAGSGLRTDPQSTISRVENLPDKRTLLRRLGRALVDLYCASFPQVPRRITLDIDDTFHAVHGRQQLRLPRGARLEHFSFCDVRTTSGI